MDLFISESTLVAHYNAQNSQHLEYLAHYKLIVEQYQIPMTIIKRARVLAAALMRNDRDLVKYLFTHGKYDLPTVLKTCEILDSRRLAKQLTAKCEKLKKKRNIVKQKSIIANLNALNEGLEVSLTRSKIKLIIRYWVNKISSADLEALALQFPKKQWVKLANLLHTKDSDFELSWFNAYIFGKEIPADAVIQLFKSEAGQFTAAHLNLLSVYKPNYSWLTKTFKELPKEAFAVLAGYTEFDKVFQNWNVFKNHAEIIINRLQTEPCNMEYGAIMHFLVKTSASSDHDAVCKELARIAEDKLRGYNIEMASPVTVLADASSSMEVAIQTSTIISSVLCSLFTANLRLFNKCDQLITKPPRSVDDVLRLGKKLRAEYVTSPAASMKAMLDEGRVVKTIIIVTDQEENTTFDCIFNGQPLSGDKMFAQVFKNYHDTVYPAQLVFISFLPNGASGQMIPVLRELDSNIKISEYVMNISRPDLRKIDTILNQMTVRSERYEQEFARVLGDLTNTRVNKVDPTQGEDLTNTRVTNNVDPAQGEDLTKIVESLSIDSDTITKATNCQNS